MPNVCLTIIIIVFLKWDVLSQNAPHVLACFCGWQRDRWAFFVHCPLSNVHFILPLELICSSLLLAYLLTAGFLLKHKFYQCLVQFSSLFGSPLLSRSKVMIYVFMSSLLYLNGKKFHKNTIFFVLLPLLTYYSVYY